MATDKKLHTGFFASQYAKLSKDDYRYGVVVKNSAHEEFPTVVNFSYADDVRLYADYLRELADDMDAPKRERDALVELLSSTIYYHSMDAESIADALIEAGYHT
jgi:hypothetical protein